MYSQREDLTVTRRVYNVANPLLPRLLAAFESQKVVLGECKSFANIYNDEDT